MKRNWIKRKKEKRKRWIDISGGIVSVIMLFILLNPFKVRTQEKETQKYTRTNQQQAVQKNTDLEQILVQNTKEYTGNWFIYIKNIEESTVTTINHQQKVVTRLLQLYMHSLFFQESENMQITNSIPKNEKKYLKNMIVDQNTDAAMILSSDGKYIICVVSQGHKDKNTAKKEIENISQCVYTYYKQ